MQIAFLSPAIKTYSTLRADVIRDVKIVKKRLIRSIPILVTYMHSGQSASFSTSGAPFSSSDVSFLTSDALFSRFLFVLRGSVFVFDCFVFDPTIFQSLKFYASFIWNNSLIFQKHIFQN